MRRKIQKELNIHIIILKIMLLKLPPNLPMTNQLQTIKKIADHYQMEIQEEYIELNAWAPGCKLCPCLYI